MLNKSLSIIFVIFGFVASAAPALAVPCDGDGFPPDGPLISNANPSTYGSTVTFAPGLPGVFDFFEYQSPIFNYIDSGATYSTNTLSVGQHEIWAVSVSGAFCVLQTVQQAAPTLLLSSSSNPAVPGASVTLTATLGYPAGALAPTGSVQFFDGAVSLGSSTLSSGSAILNVSSLSAGPHSLTVVYGGDTNYTTSTSAAVAQSITYRIGAQTRMNLVLPGLKSNPAITTGASGDALAVWEMASSAGAPAAIRGRFYSNTTQAPVGNEINVAAPAAGQGAPQIVGLSNGDYVVVWHADGATAGDREIFARLYAPDGTPRGMAGQVNVVTANDQSFPVVAALAGGNFVIVWQTNGEDGAGYGLVGRMYANAGTPLGAPFPINNKTAGDQLSPAITALTGGGFVVGWAGPQTTGEPIVFLRRFDATGAKVGVETRVTMPLPGAASDIALSMLPADQFMIAWSQPETNASSTPRDVFLQRYLATGAKNGPIVRLSKMSGSQSMPAAAMLDGGRSVVAWTAPDTDQNGVFAQAFDATGARAASRFAVNSVNAGEQRGPKIAPLGAGTNYGKNYVIVWSAKTPAGLNEGIYLQRFAAPAP